MTEHSLPTQVENPKLTLYAFHLCHDIATDEGKRVEDSEHLWQTFETLGQALGIESLATCRYWLNLPENGGMVPFRELLSEEIGRCLRFPIPFAETQPVTPQCRRNGELYALQLHDTYAADLTFRYTGIVSIDQLTDLNPHGKLLSNQIQPSLGQTLVLFAKPVSNGEFLQTESLKLLAENCVTALLKEADKNLPSPVYIAEGKLLGSPIFEYDNFAEDPAQSCHILIWLNCHDDTAKLEADAGYYHSLFNLLCCRHKMRFSYHQARERNRDARAISNQLENKVKALENLPGNVSERLNVLKQSLLETTPKTFIYSSYLRDIEDHRTAIITNFKNYNTALKQLNKIEGENELSFLQSFDNQSRKYLAQIRTDLNYLKPGETLFGHCIATMRGIVEVEQAEINDKRQQADKDLQDHIQGIGVGIAAGAIVASNTGLITQPWKMPWSNQRSSIPHPFFIALCLSVLCSWGAWQIAKQRIKKRRFN